jgi:hypothetical protein
MLELTSFERSVLDQMETQPKLVVLDTMNFLMDCALPELMDVIKRCNYHQ